jgi:L-iditol 2-dehydrogenase
MKAGVLDNFKKWKYFDDFPDPVCDESHILVKVKHSSICSTDVLRSMQTGFYHYPIIPGHEFCGEVVDKGNTVRDSNLSTGDKVAVYPLMNCGICRACQNNHPNLCDDYNFLGSRTNGGYGEYITAPPQNLIQIPDSVNLEKASLTEPAAVALHAFKIAGNLDGVESVAIFGLGPIAYLVALWAKYYGIKQVIGIGRSDHRLDMGKAIGMDNLIDTRIIIKEDHVSTVAAEKILEFTNGEGADLIFECSGSNVLQPQTILSAAKSGKIIILGNPTHSLKLDRDIYSMILRKELTIKGSWSSCVTPKNEWAEVLDIINKGDFDPSVIITHTFELEQVKSVMEDMYFKKFDYSKVCFKI